MKMKEIMKLLILKYYKKKKKKIRFADQENDNNINIEDDNINIKKTKNRNSMAELPDEYIDDINKKIHTRNNSQNQIENLNI
jgi:hypothetical protein